MSYEYGEQYRLIATHGAGLIVRVALGAGRSARTTLYVKPGTLLTCAGSIAGDGGPVVGWVLTREQRWQAEQAINRLSSTRGFAELASALEWPGADLRELVEPIGPAS